MSKLVVITGRRGKGKTSLAYHLASQLGGGVAVYDPTQAFAIGAIAHNREEFDLALERELSPAVFQVTDSEGRKDAVEEDLREFVSAIKHIRDISVVIDETSYLQSPNWIAPALDDEIRVGRRRHHDLYLTQHRMADCNGILLDLVTEFKFFQTKNPRSLERIAEYCGDRVAGLVSTLADFEFLHYDVESGAVFVNCEPEFWRVRIAPEEVATPLLSAAAD
jgi:hypothetical protein